MTAGRFQRGIGVPPGAAAFGSPTTFGIMSTTEIQRQIAYAFMFQVLPAAQSKVVKLDARGLIQRLQTALVRDRGSRRGQVWRARV